MKHINLKHWNHKVNPNSDVNLNPEGCNVTRVGRLTCDIITLTSSYEPRFLIRFKVKRDLMLKLNMLNKF